MASIPYRLGTAASLVIAPEQPDGTKPETSDMRMELRVPFKGQCLVLHAEAAPEGFEIDLSQLTLSPGIYPDAAIHFLLGQEDFYFGKLHLNIEGGC